jgi:thiol-disulfide isomerase/thioredoxin
VIRTASLAGAFAALPFLPDAELSTDAWLAVGLGIALAAVAALAVALLALAREVGELRLAVAPQAALSLAHEGPEVGGRVALVERFERDAPLNVAVFSSPSCPLCAALEPSLRLLADDPEVEVRVFDEHDDADAWESLAVPGSPYAVVLDADGIVLSKGTFNSLYQLESLVRA